MALQNPVSSPVDIDDGELVEWRDSVDAVVAAHGPKAAARVLGAAWTRARSLGLVVPGMPVSDYVNTLPPGAEPVFPGDEVLEARIRHYVRWNAAVMVARANRRADGIGGHLATYASAATLYEVGFNHFFRGADTGPGDQVYFQGHAAPGIYARAYLEGRLAEADLDGFRREVGGGLPSYPHPRRSDFWQFPTVSMGLGPLMAAYQARFNRYLTDRGVADVSGSRVWCFVGDGEMDEPESLAAVAMAGREKLANLTFVVNCNLQRLDGPVRGNGKVIQELEGLFAGAGWNVVKVVWAREWDPLLAADVDGVLLDKMNTTLDGEYQKYRVESGAFIRERFFGPDPRLTGLVAHLSDDDLRRLRRGGHDPKKVYAAYRAAVEHTAGPTVVLAKTVKGWALGPDVEARNATHQIKKLTEAELRVFRDRLELPIPDRALADDLPPYAHPGFDSEEYRYLAERRRVLGGPLPARRSTSGTLAAPEDKVYEELLAGTGPKVAASTTGAFTRLLRGLLRDPHLGRRVVPIVPDEARTFGIDGLFREVGIYQPGGQRYEPVDAGLLLSYHEAPDGQILEEGITEAGAMASTLAAGTSYAALGEATVPFFVHYSMFGFHRAADLLWAFGDARGRGFVLAATAGRTTLQGEGLQHCDGQSLLYASAHPSCRAYDPAFAYEVAVIVRAGVAAMYGSDPEDVFYYLTLYNESYPMPAMPEGVEEGIVAGLYRYAAAPETGGPRARLLGSGPALLTALDARRVLAERYGVAAEVWSATSYKALREDALSAERGNRLHPGEPARVPYVTRALAGPAPVIAVSDFTSLVPDQVARFVSAPYTVLGTDGFGLSDTREALRRHFEVDAAHVALTVLDALARSGELDHSVVAKAVSDLDIDAQAVDPHFG